MQNQLIEQAREAVTALRDAARTGTVIDFRQRDPLVLVLHNVIDKFAAMVEQPVRLSCVEIRGGEEGDEGPVQSTDLFLSGRGVSLLVNVPAGNRATYSGRVDQGPSQSGTIGA